MPTTEKPSFNSLKIQRAYKINNIEHTRLLGRVHLIEKAKLHAVRITNNDIRMVSNALDNIQACTGASPEGLPPEASIEEDNEEKEAIFLYGERTRSRRFGKFRKLKPAASQEDGELSEKGSTRDSSSYRRSHSAIGGRRASFDSQLSLDTTDAAVRPKSTPSHTYGRKTRLTFNLDPLDSTSSDEEEDAGTMKPPETPREAFTSSSVMRSSTRNAFFSTGFGSTRSSRRLSSGATSRSHGGFFLTDGTNIDEIHKRSKSQSDIQVSDLQKLLKKRVTVQANEFQMPRRPTRSAPGIRSARIVEVVNKARAAAAMARRWRSAARDRRSMTDIGTPMMTTRIKEKSEKNIEFKLNINSQRLKELDSRVDDFKNQYSRSRNGTSGPTVSVEVT